MPRPQFSETQEQNAPVHQTWGAREPGETHNEPAPPAPVHETATAPAITPGVHRRVAGAGGQATL